MMKGYRALGIAIGGLALLAVATLGVHVTAAQAGDAKGHFRAGSPGGHRHHLHGHKHFRHGDRHFKHPGLGDHFKHFRQPQRHHFGQRGHLHLRHGFFHGPSYPHVVAPRWVPGYWTYRWIPSGATAYVWVPGYYTAAGFWVGGHHAPGPVQSGYYERVWLDGYWAR